MFGFIFFELFQAELFLLCRWLVDWHLYILLFLSLKVEINSVGERCTPIKVKTFWEGTAVTLCLRSLGIILIGDSSIFWKVVIPNGLYSEKFYSKGLSFRNLYLERSLFQRFLSRRVIIPKFRKMPLRDKNLRNTDFRDFTNTNK